MFRNFWNTNNKKTFLKILKFSGKCFHFPELGFWKSSKVFDFWKIFRFSKSEKWKYFPKIFKIFENIFWYFLGEKFRNINRHHVSQSPAMNSGRRQHYFHFSNFNFNRFSFILDVFLVQNQLILEGRKEGKKKGSKNWEIAVSTGCERTSPVTQWQSPAP